MKYLSAILVALLAVQTIAGQARMDDPQIRIQQDFHSDSVESHALSADEQYFVTGSRDGTARLWDVATGDLLHVLRAPNMGGSNVTAVAFSPDSQFVLVATYYGERDAGGEPRVGLYRVSNGTLVRTYEAMGGRSVAQIEYSPDGRYVAFGGWPGNPVGIEVRDARTMNVISRLSNGYGAYYARSQTFTWGPDGSLFTFSPHSGNTPAFLRRYDGRFELSYERLFESRFIYTIDVSESGDRVAMAYRPEYNGPVIVDVIDARRGLRSVNQIRDANTTSIWWEGDELRGWSHSWGMHGREARRSAIGLRYQLSNGNRFGVAGMSIAVASPSNRWTTLSGFSRLRIPGSWSDAGRGTLRLSNDGTVVDVTDFDGHRWVLDVLDRELDRRATDYAPSSARRGRTIVEGRQWDVTINGRNVDSLSKYPGGASPNYDVAYDGESVVFGGTWLSVYDTRANRIWDRGQEFGYGAVRFSPDGQYVVAVTNHGTIQWHRVEDGELVLTLFIRPDTETWVAWTPSGYYDASPGGESLIGWHVNRGETATPDFFPATTFRERFYRPDVIREIIRTRDEDEALRIANGRRNVRVTSAVADTLPPAVRILSPTRNMEIRSREVTVELDINTPDDAPVNDIRVLLNGRPAPSQRGLSRDTGTRRELSVDLASVNGDEAVITVLAANRHGFGPPVDVTLRLAGSQFEEFTVAPRLYLLAVGVSDYRDDVLDLSYAAKDARDVAEFFETQSGGLYRDVDVRLLTDRDATRAAIEDGLYWLEEQVTANDMAAIFIAGHGINDNSGELHFAPHDVAVDRLRRTGLPASDIVDTIRYLQGRVVYFMDACHSGNLDFVRRSVGGVDLNGLIQDLSAAETGAVVFSSAAGSQYALESPAWGNGAFTRAMLQAFRGDGDYNNDGAVSVNELNLFVSQEVKQLTNNQQTPVLQKPDSIRDFPLGVVR